MAKSKVKYKRVLLKLSGEALMGNRGYGIDPETVAFLAQEIRETVNTGAKVAIVIGGGNIFRGIEAATQGMERVSADYMGMLATVMNAIALRDSMEAAGLQARVLSAIPMPQVCESFSARQAADHLESGRVVILAAGTGCPLFTTDMCAALRAGELGADVLLKATKVDGVFDDDPVLNPQARKYDELTYQKVLADRLAVMDLTAISMCMENHIPIVVFKLSQPGNLLKALTGQQVGTTVTS